MITGAETLGGGPAQRAETVTEFTRRVKALLKGGLPAAWVRGEVSNVRAQASGHVYFSVKDAGAQLSAVLFRGDALRQGAKLRDGLQVVAYGEVDVYEARGQYQLIVRLVVEDGVGRLQREFEALKRKLAEEGLFAPERKRPIPTLPATIGFITSATGAAVQDFLRILVRRGWRGRIVVLPARVQGEGAAAEMAEMVALAAGLGIFDLLVLGRGGGSAEDLWAFNEEPLVRAVAACPIPLVSAVGHEIDFTLSDFVADVRAETPSAAAELISSHFVAGLERAGRARTALAAAAGQAGRPRPGAARPCALAAAPPHARGADRARLPAARRLLEPPRDRAADGGPSPPPGAGRGARAAGAVLARRPAAPGGSSARVAGQATPRRQPALGAEPGLRHPAGRKGEAPPAPRPGAGRTAPGGGVRRRRGAAARRIGFSAMAHSPPPTATTIPRFTAPAAAAA